MSIPELEHDLAYAPAPAHPRPSTRTVQRRTARVRLQVVPPAQPRPPVVRLVAACAVIGVMGLIATLYLNTLTAKDAYRLHDAQRAAAALKAQEESLAHQVDALNDPMSIAAKAASLGMVPSDSPIFITPTGTLGAKLPKGTKVSYPTTDPANGLIVVGKPTPKATTKPTTPEAKAK